MNVSQFEEEVVYKSKNIRKYDTYMTQTHAGSQYLCPSYYLSQDKCYEKTPK